jgi:hypothetical protein
MNLRARGNNLPSLAWKTRRIATLETLGSGVRPVGRSYGETMVLHPTQFTHPKQEAPLEF